jgi:hypothetical protein
MAGRKIDDHSAWMGKGSEGSVLPLSSKMKQFSSAGGNERSGSLDYHDTTEEIERDQEHGIGKAKSHKLKPGYRN